MEKISYLIALLSVLVSSTGQVFLKTEAEQEHKNFLRKFLNIRVIFSYGLMLLSLTLNTIALRYIPLKRMPGITATSFLWVLCFSFLFLKEKPGKYKLLGTFLIMVGVIISGVS